MHLQYTYPAEHTVQYTVGDSLHTMCYTVVIPGTVCSTKGITQSDGGAFVNTVTECMHRNLLAIEPDWGSLQNMPLTLIHTICSNNSDTHNL